MHELGIMTGVMEAVEKSAVQAGATKVLNVTLSIGEMTAAIEDSLRFAFEVLTEGTMSEGAELEINMVKPRSLCLDCGAEYEHDRFHMVCPECGGYNTKLLAGRELQIDSIEVDLPDDYRALARSRGVGICRGSPRLPRVRARWRSWKTARSPRVPDLVYH